MKRIIFLMVILALTLFAFSNTTTYYEAQVFFNNGNSKIGQFAFTILDNDKFLICKNGIDSQTEMISTDSVKSIIYNENNEKTEFGFLRGYLNWGQVKMSKPTWMQLIVKGTVSLYFISTSMSGATYMSTGGFTNYYVIREGEPAAKLYSMTASFNNNLVFRAKAPLYFADYPELAEKIKNKVYTWKDQVEVVKIYNEWASHNKKTDN